MLITNIFSCYYFLLNVRQIVSIDKCLLWEFSTMYFCCSSNNNNKIKTFKTIKSGFNLFLIIICSSKKCG